MEASLLRVARTSLVQIPKPAFLPKLLFLFDAGSMTTWRRIARPRGIISTCDPVSLGFPRSGIADIAQRFEISLWAAAHWPVWALQNFGQIMPRECEAVSIIRHSGAPQRGEPGISNFRVRCCASPRNDNASIITRRFALLRRHDPGSQRHQPLER